MMGNGREDCEKSWQEGEVLVTHKGSCSIISRGRGQCTTSNLFLFAHKPVFPCMQCHPTAVSSIQLLFHLPSYHLPTTWTYLSFCLKHHGLHGKMYILNPWSLCWLNLLTSLPNLLVWIKSQSLGVIAWIFPQRQIWSQGPVYRQKFWRWFQKWTVRA